MPQEGIFSVPDLMAHFEKEEGVSDDGQLVPESCQADGVLKSLSWSKSLRSLLPVHREKVRTLTS
jgi:hypothetical protein